MEERDAGEEPACSRPKCYVVVHNVAKRHNIGTLARSATAFGVTEIILVGKKDYNAFGSHGATVHIGFRHFHTLSAAVLFLKEQECDICGVEIADGALAVESHPFKRNTAFVVGNEGSGLSAKEMEAIGHLVTQGSMVGFERPVFVLFGSSLVQYSYKKQGWGSVLNDLYSRKADFLLRGYAGWNSRQALAVLDRVFPKESAVQPALVIVLLGGNDSALPTKDITCPHVPLAEFKENMRKITAHIKGLSETTRVILITCAPVNVALMESHLRQLFADSLWAIPPPGKSLEGTKAYAEACKEIAAEFPDVGIVDLHTAIQRKHNWENTCVVSDGVHLSAEGSAVVVEEVLKVLKNVDWVPSLNRRHMPSQFPNMSPLEPVLDGL